MDLDFDDRDYVATYHQRMTDIQHVSDVIAIANLQLNKVFSRLSWSKDVIKKEKTSLFPCSINKDHDVTERNMSKHLLFCALRKNGITDLKEKDICCDPSFAYKDSTGTCPVFISSQTYKDLGRPIESGKNNEQGHQSRSSLMEKELAINDYIASDPIDELRFIYSWENIPKKYFTLQNHGVPLPALKDWLMDNVSTLGAVSCGAQALVNSIMLWMNTPLNADQFLSYIEEVSRKDSRLFVMKLWKFVCAKSLCIHQKIPEHTRNEFDFYSCVQTPVITLPSASAAGLHPFLPMEWVHYNLDREQKLKLYEYTTHIAKLVSKPSLDFNELQEEAEKQMKVLAELNAEKSGQKTQLEIMAEMRDYKRRRQSYRGKNKANRKMTGLEVLREVVEQEMLYFKLLQEKQKIGDEDPTTERELASSTTELELACSTMRAAARVESTRSRSSEKNASKISSRSRSRTRRSRSPGERKQSRNRGQDHSRSKRQYGSNYSRSRDREIVRSDTFERRYSTERHDRRKERKSRDGEEIRNITYY